MSRQTTPSWSRAYALFKVFSKLDLIDLPQLLCHNEITRFADKEL